MERRYSSLDCFYYSEDVQKKQKKYRKIMLKIMKNDVPRPPKIHKKTSSEKRREKKTQKIRLSAKMIEN